MKHASGFSLPHLFSHALLLSACISLASYAHSATLDMQAGIQVQHDDNVTRTMNNGNKVADQSLMLSISQPFVLPIYEHARTIFTGGLDAAQYRYLEKLSHVSGRIQGEVQYRGSAEFGTPTYALFAKAALVDYQSKQRDGLEFSYGISVRKTLTDRIKSYAAILHHQRNAQNTVFKNKYDAILFNLDYDIRAVGTLYLGGEYRDGDMAISALWWSWYPIWSPADITRDDAFSGWSYRVKGTTRIVKAGFNLPVGSRSSLDFSWNQATSSATYWTNLGSSATKGSYTTNRYSIAYLFRL